MLRTTFTCQERIWQVASLAKMQSPIASYQGTAAKDSTFVGADIRGMQSSPHCPRSTALRCAALRLDDVDDDDD